MRGKSSLKDLVIFIQFVLFVGLNSTTYLYAVEEPGSGNGRGDRFIRSSKILDDQERILYSEQDKESFAKTIIKINTNADAMTFLVYLAKEAKVYKDLFLDDTHKEKIKYFLEKTVSTSSKAEALNLIEELFKFLPPYYIAPKVIEKASNEKKAKESVANLLFANGQRKVDLIKSLEYADYPFVRKALITQFRFSLAGKDSNGLYHTVNTLLTIIKSSNDPIFRDLSKALNDYYLKMRTEWKEKGELENIADYDRIIKKLSVELYDYVLVKTGDNLNSSSKNYLVAGSKVENLNIDENTTSKTNTNTNTKTNTSNTSTTKNLPAVFNENAKFSFLSAMKDLDPKSAIAVKMATKFEGSGYFNKNESGFEHYRRVEDLQKIYDSLIRLDIHLPMVLSSQGGGKTSMLEQLAEEIHNNRVPSRQKFQDMFRKTSTLITSPFRIERLAQGESDRALASSYYTYLKLIESAATALDQKVIVLIDDFHHAPKSALQYLYEFLEEAKYTRVIVFANDIEMNAKLKDNSRYNRFIDKIMMKDFTDQEVRAILENDWLKKLTTEFGVKYDSKAVEALLEVANNTYSGIGKLNASIKLSQEIAISNYRDFGKSEANNKIEKNLVYKVSGNILGLPVNPNSELEFSQYIEDLNLKLNKEVVGQAPSIDIVLKYWADLLLDSERSVRVGLLSGKSGTGKTELATLLAKHGLSNSNAVIELDGNDYKEKHDVDRLRGSAPGYIGYGEGGELIKFLSDENRGGRTSILVINEIEKMHPEVLEYLMEFFDKGVIQDARGVSVKPKKCLVLLTTNAGDEKLLPKTMKNWTQAERDSHIRSVPKEDILQAVVEASTKRGNTLHESIVRRIDFASVFDLATLESAKIIANNIVDATFKKYLKEKSFKFQIRQEVKDQLVENFFESNEGYRPFVRQFKAYLSQAYVSAMDKWGKIEEGKTLSINASSTEKSKFILRYAGKSLKIEAPVVPDSDPLNDSNLVDKLISLEEGLNKRIIGQEYSNKILSEAVISHLSSPYKTRPLSIVTVGSSGTGKTFTAKTLAHHLYGSEGRVIEMFLGDINNELQFNDLFGNPSSTKGGDKLSLFEKNLINNPKGGVFVMDEFSNIGGFDLRLKDMLLKNFYNMLEEGKWTSPNSGKTFDLSKFTFIWTGNDGENLFSGVTADQQRLKIWKRFRSKDRIFEILSHSGVPEAFLGRQATLLLQKPLLKEEMKLVVQDLVKPELDRLSARVKKVNLSEGFYNQVGASFFAQSTGARSVRNAIDINLGGAITYIYLMAKKQNLDLSKMELNISIKDNLPKAPHVTNKFERVVEFQVDLVKNSKVIMSRIVDAKADAAPVILMNKSDAKLATIHELGHAESQRPNITKMKTIFITIIGGKTKSLTYLGYADFDYVKNSAGHNPDKESIVTQLSVTRAGGLAQKLAGFPLDAGWNDDNMKARAMVSNAILKYQLDPRLQFYAVDSNNQAILTEAQRTLLNEIVNEWMLEADKLAIKTLTEKWNVVRLGSAILMKKGYITEDELYQIEEDAKKIKTKWRVVGDDIFNMKIVRKKRVRVNSCQAPFAS